MYKKIVGNGLKKNMRINSIIFILVLMSSLIMLSGINLLSITLTAIPGYLEKANLADVNFFVGKYLEDDIQEFAKENAVIKESEEREYYNVKNKDFILPDDCDELPTVLSIFVSEQQEDMNYIFNMDDKNVELTDGQIALPVYFKRQCNLAVGDKITIKVGEKKIDFKVSGFFKDALLGSSFISTKRVIVNSHDFELLTKDLEDSELLSVWSMNFEDDFDADTFEVLLRNSCDVTPVLIFNKALLSSALFLENGIVAAILLLVSMIAIIISLLIVIYLVRISVIGEFKQIGILKAIGISNGRIKGIFLAKYISVCCMGCFAGYAISLPIVSKFVDYYSETMVIEQKGEVRLIPVICLAVLIGIIILSIFMTMRYVNKLTPLDFIKDNVFNKKAKVKSGIRLNKWGNRYIGSYLSINSLVRGKKNYILIGVVSVLCVFIIVVPLNLYNTMNNPKFVEDYCGVSKGDFYISNVELDTDEDGYIELADINDQKEKLADKLKNKGIDAELHGDLYGSIVYISDDKKIEKRIGYLKLYKSTDKYAYVHGEGPKTDGEIAITTVMKEKYDKDVGDTISFKQNDKLKIYTITGIYQAVYDNGYTVRMADDYSPKCISSVTYVGHMREEGEIPFDKIEEELKNFNVISTTDYLNQLLGNIQEVLKYVILAICAVATIFIAVLTYLFAILFIRKDEREIALVKSIGMKQRQIFFWQGLRIILTFIIGIILGCLSGSLFGEKLMSIALSSYGITNISFIINYVEVIVLLPIGLICITVLILRLALIPIRNIKTWSLHVD